MLLKPTYRVTVKLDGRKRAFLCQARTPEQAAARIRKGKVVSVEKYNSREAVLAVLSVRLDDIFEVIRAERRFGATPEELTNVRAIHKKEEIGSSDTASSPTISGRPS